MAELHGIMAVFDTPEALLAAVREARHEGYSHLDAYSPHPVPGMVEALGIGRGILPWVTFVVALVAGAGIYGLQWFTAVVAFPFNTGGKPAASWPAFVPPTIVAMILFSGLATFVAMLALNRLPQYYHPVFNAKPFARVSMDRYCLCLEAHGEEVDVEAARRFLRGLSPLEVVDVAP